MNVEESKSNDALASINDEEETTFVEKARPVYHKVKLGESLFSIARANGLTVKQICKINGISSRSRLRVGQILKCK